MRTPLATIPTTAVALCLAFAPVAAAQPAPGAAFVDPARGVLSFAPLIEAALPTVVRIVSLGPAQAMDGRRRIRGNGSGAIIDAAAGLVITNAHVVREAEALRVELADGRQFDATLLGADEATDIALLRIPAENLAEIELADSDALRVGDLVFAVGYPFGLDQTLTMGIVSGLGRSQGGEGIEDFIQTDAPINAGNSGGPLLDSRGRLVGVNTAILSPGGRQGGNVGIGFVTPSRIALAVAEQIERFGEVRRGRIGITMQAMDGELAESLGMPRPEGVLVGGVEPDSTAAAAGLARGDVILSADGRELSGPSGLRAAIAVLEPGASIALDVLRRGERLEITVEIGAPPRAQVAVAADGEAISVFGATFRDPTPEDELPPALAGPVATEILDGFAASLHGLSPGDAVVFVNDRRISSAAELADAVADTPAPWRLGMIRRGVNAVVPLVISE